MSNVPNVSIQVYFSEVVSYLARSQGHLGVGGLAELGQLGQDGHQLVCQRGIPPTQLVLQRHRQGGVGLSPVGDNRILQTSWPRLQEVTENNISNIMVKTTYIQRVNNLRQYGA